MSLNIIEVTKGFKPEGNVLKFGGTSEYDFYIKSSGDVRRSWYNDGFFRDFNNIINRKYFEFSMNIKNFRNRIM